MFMLNSRYTEARSRCEEALPVALASDDRSAEAHLLNTLGFSMVMLGAQEEGIARLHESRDRAGEAGDLDSVCRAYTNLVTVLPLVGRYTEALAVADEGLAMMREHHVELSAGAVLLGITASVLFRRGAWRQAEAMAQTVLERAVPNGLALFAHLTRVELDIALGDLASAEERLERAVRCAEGTTDPMALADLLAVTAELAICRQDHAEVRSAVSRGLALLENTEEDHLAIRLCALGLRSEADRGRRGRAGSSGTVDLLIRRARDALTGPTACFPEAHANGLTCQAEYNRAVAGRDAGRWAAAAEAWEGLGFPAEACYCRLREAEAAFARRATRLAAVALTAARQHAETLPDPPALLLSQIDDLARRGRIDPTGSRGVEPNRLTPRELEVLSLLGEGRSNRQIGEKLFIAEKTAGVHIGNILMKLAVERRGEAVAKARQLGLLD
jgi:ATP/maltotriose-dependent transcriptional regulator MalT